MNAINFAYKKKNRSNIHVIICILVLTLSFEVYNYGLVMTFSRKSSIAQSVVFLVKLDIGFYN